MKTKGLTLLSMFAILSLSALGQESEKRFGFELSSGASFATNKLDGASLNPGFGFEGIFHYRFMENTGIYAGWGWNRFASDNSFAGTDVCFEETGYVFGLQYKRLLGESPIAFYVRGGGLYNHIEIENADGKIINDSGHGFGWQAAGGVDVSLGSNWSLTPGLKFNSLSRDTEFEGVTKTLNLNYISVRVAILKKF